MTAVVIDDHLLRDILAGDRPRDLGGVASSVSTTGLWLFRLCRAWAAPGPAGRLAAPVASLPTEQQALFVDRLVTLPADIGVVHLRDLSWPMAQLQRYHRERDRPLSAAMVEALAAARLLEAAIAVSRFDVGPNLQAAAEHDGIPFHIM